MGPKPVAIFFVHNECKHYFTVTKKILKVAKKIITVTKKFFTVHYNFKIQSSYTRWCKPVKAPRV